MKRLIIVVEGQTEQEFVEQCLRPYLAEKYQVYSVSGRLIGKPGHKGGNVKFSRLKTDVDILLKEKDVIVSMLIDYFRLASDFPNFDQCQQLNVVDTKLDVLEQALAYSINDRRFVPYIQKHEFEALLFASDSGFIKYLKPKTCDQLRVITEAFNNPEDINNDQPPSYRLIDVMKSIEGLAYDKPAYGNIFALEVGIEQILAKCPRFAQWVERLIKAVLTS